MEKASKNTINSFSKGMVLDISNMVAGNNIMTYAMNVRLKSTEGTDFAATNIKGTEVAFSLSSLDGVPFEPVAAEEYRNVLYIISWHPTGNLEIGSYPSVDPSGGTNIWVYRPLNNLTGGAAVGNTPNPFRTTLFNTPVKPVIQKLEIQSEYDSSVNLCFSIKKGKPRIVNSFFSVSGASASMTLSYSPTRPGNANSNYYSLSSVEKETRLVISTTKVLKVAYGSVSSGGKLKPGMYKYVFKYMTEDFNMTDVVAQSSAVQVAFGTNSNNLKGGDETQETNLRVSLSLSNIDTDFKYLKVYCMYSSGQNTTFEQYLEFDVPVSIVKDNMEFYHSGFENLIEIEKSEVDRNYIILDAADTSVQVGGYLLLGGIRQRNYNYLTLKQLAAEVLPIFSKKQLPSNTSLSGYADPENTYKYLGYWGGEKYPFTIVFKMLDGSLSPAFPIRDVSIDGDTHTYKQLTQGQIDAGEWYKGIVSFPRSSQHPVYSAGSLNVKYIQLNLQPLIDSSYVQQNTLGFFIARGQRRTNLICQGIFIPTFKVPAIKTINSNDNSYYSYNKLKIDDTKFFKHAPILDSLAESFAVNRFGTASFQGPVLTETNTVNGYIPIFINDIEGFSVTNLKLFYSKEAETWARHWAFISGDMLADEPSLSYVLNKDTVGIEQLAKVNFQVKGEITNLNTIFGWNLLLPSIAMPRVGLWYEQDSVSTYPSGTMKTAKKSVFVPGETLETGTDFQSHVECSFYAQDTGSGGHTLAHVQQEYNSYFGIEMLEGSEGQLIDSAKGLNNPIGGNYRIGAALLNNVGKSETSGIRYSNYGTTVPGAFLINAHHSPSYDTADLLYPTIDNISYYQATPLLEWSDIPISGADAYRVHVFGGDCFISKCYRKLNQSGFRDPTPMYSGWGDRKHIDAGTMVSWWQESNYNIALRQPHQFDMAETEQRSFFPYQSSGDFIKYRSYRYPETAYHSLGYAKAAPPKSFYPAPNLAPYLENNFFSRIAKSERHVPNAFKNGFRSYSEEKHRDYTSSKGEITALVNHREKLLVVFESGVFITEIDQRIQTGSDSAGAIFVEPESTLPQKLQQMSANYGCQNNLAIVQSVHENTYGMDAIKKSIWRVSDRFEVISDNVVSSFLHDYGIINPRCGYDPLNKEVLFTTDNYTLAYNERSGSFTFFNFKPDFYAKRGNDLYSFSGGSVHRHNADTFTIYGTTPEVVIEYVISENVSVAKVLDYIGISSNENPPKKVEFYTYNQEKKTLPVIDPTSSLINQYSKVEYENNSLFLKGPNFPYIDKRFMVQVPKAANYNAGSASDRWTIKSRIRSPYIMVRITYDSTKPIEVASVINSIRYSYS